MIVEATIYFWRNKTPRTSFSVVLLSFSPAFHPITTTNIQCLFQREKSHYPMPASLSIFLRDDFTLTTWMLIGACIQSILFLVLPLYVAVLFTGIFSAARIVKFVLTSRKILVDPDLTHVRYGRYTAPIPSENGSLPLKASEAEVVVFILGARSNQYAAFI